MTKYELIHRLYDSVTAKPIGSIIKKIIDPNIDRMYDGAENVTDIRKTFFQSIAQDPTHKAIIKIESVRSLEN